MLPSSAPTKKTTRERISELQAQVPLRCESLDALMNYFEFHKYLLFKTHFWDILSEEKPNTKIGYFFKCEVPHDPFDQAGFNKINSMFASWSDDDLKVRSNVCCENTKLVISLVVTKGYFITLQCDKCKKFMGKRVEASTYASIKPKDKGYDVFCKSCQHATGTTVCRMDWRHDIYPLV